MSCISFGTDGWRAIIAEHFTFANVEKVTYAIGQYVNKTYGESGINIAKDTANLGNLHGPKVPVLVGYDTRFLADSFARRVAQVLISMGIPARLSERDVPTPVIAFASQAEPTGGAIQLTASHNPPEYCGIKYIPHFGGPATNEITGQIVNNLVDLPYAIDVYSLEVPRFNPKPLYMQALVERVDFKKIAQSGLKIGVDCLYSTCRGYLDEILSKHGITVKILHNWRDPLFGGGMPEPTANYLKDLSKLVVNEKLNLGVATDGDADRFGVIDEYGNYFSPNQLITLLVKHLVKNRRLKGAVVRTVATTHLLDRLCYIYGLELLETPVGFKYIGELMRTKDVLIGGEESGGVSIKGHIPEKDGILANLLLIEMMAYEGKSLSQIWAELTKEVGVEFAYLRRDLHLTTESQKQLVEKLNNRSFTTINNLLVEKISELDGLKYYLSDGSWILVRPSGTEPLIRFYFEAPSLIQVHALKFEFDKMIDEMLNKLGARVLSSVH